MKKIIMGLLLSIMFLPLFASATFAESTISVKSNPLPPAVAQLPTIEAKLWLNVTDDPGVFLEGPAFDRDGNLYVTSIFDSRVLKITPDKQVNTIFSQEGLLPDGIAIHKNGRLFLACISGKFISINPDGSDPQEITVRANGKPQVGNDLVFDNNGNLYVTDWTGIIGTPSGGVYRFSADLKTVDTVMENLTTANGVALSPSGTTLYVSETNLNRLVAINLLPDGIKLHPIEGTKVPWRFSGSAMGGGPDSNAMDEDGNLYQCVIFQGRVLIFNKDGIPVANVVVPGRDQGKYLRTTNVAFKPGSSEVYLTSSGDDGGAIFTFNGLAKGLPLYSHK